MANRNEGRVVKLNPTAPTATPASKHMSLDALANFAAGCHHRGERIVLCHGTYDLLHVGHIKHLQAARKLGDRLLVTLTADPFVNKGPDRPVFTEALRAESIAALECVDGVAINSQETAVNVIEALRPHVYVKGSDYIRAQDDVTGNIRREQEAVEAAGGRIHFTQEATFSSSTLLNEHFSALGDDVREFIQAFRRRHDHSTLNTSLERLADLDVLVVGDIIIDEYHYTRSLGQTGKGNVLSVQYDSSERFAGGSIAVANHVAGFAHNVTLLGGLGGQETHEGFIREHLRGNVSAQFFTNPASHTLVKRRYIGDDASKLFEVYFGGEALTSADMESDISQWLDEHLAQFDAVIVPDFGNGFITQGIVNSLTRGARFLAVNTQVNSGNRGYHVITRYPRADFISLNEPELRMAAGDRHGDIETIAGTIAEHLDAKHLAVTRGTRGVLMQEGDNSHAIPALAGRVVDRIGAGDAFLSIAGLCLAADVPADIAGFFGSIAGAMNVQTVCNREPVDPVQFRKYMATLLK
ncbi:MAG: adenylyltransferase/cytidyltransferase family protein [Gammaproteobacteria bacterium]|nr:adenylyltransferase/cytidyltransferase family protein [Gammaproteobacteria bacterium]